MKTRHKFESLGGLRSRQTGLGSADCFKGALVVRRRRISKAAKERA